MNEAIFALVSEYGVYVIFASAFLSCLALPIPTSLMMLSGGAFIVAGDLAAAPVVLAAFGGAVLGDQAGFLIGRYGGAPVIGRIARSPARRAVLTRAQALVNRHGALGVFLSTWLIAPLGPWVNFVAGATGLTWVRFAISDILGEAIWVSLYVGLGYGFASQIDTIATLMGNIVGLVAALCVAGAMVLWIRAVLRAGHLRHH